MPDLGYDKSDEHRRTVVAQGRVRARLLRASAAEGEQVVPTSAWPERGQEAVNACRVLAAFFAHHSADPVATAMAAELGAWVPAQQGRAV